MKDKEIRRKARKMQGREGDMETDYFIGSYYKTKYEGSWVIEHSQKSEKVLNEVQMKVFLKNPGSFGAGSLPSRVVKDFYKCCGKIHDLIDEEVGECVRIMNSGFGSRIPPLSCFDDIGSRFTPIGGNIEGNCENDWISYQIPREYRDCRSIKECIIDKALYLSGTGKYYGLWETVSVEYGDLSLLSGLYQADFPKCKLGEEENRNKYCGGNGEMKLKLEDGRALWACSPCLDYAWGEIGVEEEIKDIYEEVLE